MPRVMFKYRQCVDTCIYILHIRIYIYLFIYLYICIIIYIHMYMSYVLRYAYIRVRAYHIYRA